MEADAVDRLIAEYQAGATIDQLAEHFAVHRTTVMAVLKRCDVPKYPRGLDDAQLAEAVELYTAGLSTIVIGMHLGKQPSTVWSALKRAGVRLRPRNGWGT